MANILGPAVVLGFVDKRRADKPTATETVGTIANYASESDLDTRLTAISATAFSAKRLRQMTLNDKVYALRINDDSAGV